MSVRLDDNAGFRFGRERRIRRRADFVHVQTVGERATSPHFVLLVAARRPSSAASDVEGALALPPRLGVVVTRKVGNATRRNRIKRICRECFRLWPGLVPDGIDLVVIARGGADELARDGVRDEWARARPALLKRCASVLSRARTGPAAGPGGAKTEEGGTGGRVRRE